MRKRRKKKRSECSKNRDDKEKYNKTQMTMRMIMEEFQENEKK